MKKIFLAIVAMSLLSTSSFAAPTIIANQQITSIQVTASDVTNVTLSNGTIVRMGWTQDKEWVKKMTALLLTAKSSGATVDVRQNNQLLLDITIK